MFKMVGSKFELISSADMYLGIFYIAQRYNKANIKWTKSYDDNEPSKYIIYEDANNLYCNT